MKQTLKATALAVILASGLLGCGKPTFTPRILDNEDGTYTVEFYRPRNDWHKDPNGCRVSLEVARERANGWWYCATGKVHKYVE